MSFRIDDILKNTTEKDGEDFVRKTSTEKSNVEYMRSVSEPAGLKFYYNYCTYWRQIPAELYGNHLRQCCEKGCLPNGYSRQSWPLSPQPFMFHPHLNQHAKRKIGQIRFTANQTDALEKRFDSHKYLSPEDRKILADSLKLSDRQVKTWFQNRRAKWRRSISNKEPEGTGMKKIDNKSSNFVF